MKQRPPLVLNPRACDRCGACLTACPHDALRVGRTYLRVDWNRCDGCGACAKACPRRAIVRTSGDGAATGSGGASRPAPAPRKKTGAPATAGATPRSRSVAAKKQAAAEKEAAAVRRPPKGGSRGGFQWTLLEAAAMLSVTFSMFMVKEALSATEWVRGLEGDAQLPVRVSVLALYYAIQIGMIVWLVRRRGGDPLAALGLRHEGWTPRGLLISAGLVLGGFALTRAVASAYVFVTREIGLLPRSGTDLVTLFGNDEAGFVLAVVMVVLIGPVVEEAVFRGALQEGLAARFGVWPGIVVQALLFAAFHRSWWLLFPTFVLGVVLGWLAERRDSLWPPIALHALYNAITVAAVFLVAGTA